MSVAQSTRMGFGTGLPALQSAPNAVGLIETALDHGIRHIDTAPLYLWGAAEALIGEVARRRRDEMFLVSKVGLKPPSAVTRLIAKARRIVSRGAAPAAAQAGLFHPAQVAACLEASLRRLRTDRLNALLLHEIKPHDMSDALGETLKQMKSHGKALALGLATDGDSASAILREYPGLFDIVQTAWGDNADRAAAPVRVVHSVLQGRGVAIARKAAENMGFARRFAESADVDPLDRETLGALLLRAALSDTEGGIVLFSTTNPQRIAANAGLTALDAETLKRLAPFWSALS